MLDILALARERLACASDPVPCAIATIVATDGSVPRPVGTSMLVDADGSLHGSLSGGCVEGAVLEACHEALETGETAVHRFGFSEQDAFAVGLMCGGSLEVLVQPFVPGGEHPLGLVAADNTADETADATAAYVARLPHDGQGPAETAAGSVPGAVAQPMAALVTGPEHAGVASALASLVPSAVLEPAVAQTMTMVRQGRTGTLRIAPPDGVGEPIELFVESRTRPTHLVVFGANAFGQALVAAARPLGMRITLCDQRPAFTDPAAFPGAEVVRDWPHRFLDEAVRGGEVDERSILCVLTHDPKVDVPLLSRALELGVAYVGAMGSRRSDRDRRAALREAGVSESALRRLRSPIGLDLGAVTPAEVAIAILAEVLAARAALETVAPLRDGEGPLHPASG